jgi:hypothetical protein
VPKRPEGTNLTISRRYWPAIHTALKALKGKWTVHANGPVMIVSLEPHMAELLRAVLPADAVVTDPRGVGAS